MGRGASIGCCAVSKPPCHFAYPITVDGKQRGVTICGIKPGVMRGIHWTDEPRKVRGCVECGAYAKTLLMDVF